MKYLQVIVYTCLLTFFMSPAFSFAEPNHDVSFLINNGKCPKPEELGKATSKQELAKALNIIIPKVYKGEKYTEWKIEQIVPLIESPDPEAYYGMGKYYCGEKVAKNSWYVEVLFPKYLPAYDASHGQIFVTKNKEGKWFAWFKFH
ncbi:hypothetical protein ABEW33_02375 [Priestia megaterium]|uniref:hypothetical protein n=1 Tax=Priestia megaterium TaxID=1404 RepID=UPI0030C9A74E